MPKTRTSPKSYRPRMSKSARTRRVPSTRRRRTITTSGMKSGLGSAPLKHKFTRQAATLDWVSNANTQAIDIRQDSGGVSVPCTMGGVSADFSTVVGLIQIGAAWEFKLTDVANYTDFTALFDQYQIDQVDFEVSNIHNSANATENVNTMPTLYYAPDFDDNTVPASAAEMTERQRTKSWTFRGDGQPLKFSIKPRTLTQVYREGVTSAYAVGAPGFLDLANADVPYYGVKMWLQNAYLSQSGTQKGETHLRFRCTYHLSFKDPK